MNYAFLFAALVLMIAMLLVPLVFSSGRASKPQSRSLFSRKPGNVSSRIVGPQS